MEGDTDTLLRADGLGPGDGETSPGDHRQPGATGRLVFQAKSSEADRTRVNRGTERYLAINRGKKSMGLDLNKEEGRAVFYELLPGHEVCGKGF